MRHTNTSSSQQVLPLNAQAQQEVTQLKSGIQWTDTQHEPAFLVGEKVLANFPPMSRCVGQQTETRSVICTTISEYVFSAMVSELDRTNLLF